MNKKIFYLFSIFYLLQFGVLLAQDVPEPSGRRLRTIADDKFSDNSIIIGGTTGAWAFNTRTGLIMDREFNYVTPENDFKQWNIHPDPNTWNWVQPDAWIKHINANSQILRMHCPIGPQCSNWAQADYRNADELEQVMREFLRAVCERYNGVEGVISMDVVNETVQGGSWKKDEPGTGGWEMPWYKIGLDSNSLKTPLYIRYAFEIANEYAPDLKLIYNHHEDPNSVSSWNLIKANIDYLRDIGLRVDGIGWQAHVDNGWATTVNLGRLKNLIDWAHQNQLEFHVTEASVWINGAQTESAFQLQATTYTKIVEVLLEKRLSGKVGWNIWHIDDNNGWNIDRAPSLFDKSYRAKPAYYAIQQALENDTLVVPGSSGEHPKSLQLYNNYPNPFNSTTVINYSLPEEMRVLVNIYNIAGSEIKTVVIGNQAAGYQKVTWDGKDNLGRNVSSGVYVYSVRADNQIRAKKMLYLR